MIRTLPFHSWYATLPNSMNGLRQTYEASKARAAECPIMMLWTAPPPTRECHGGGTLASAVTLSLAIASTLGPFGQ
jgi:hypothetical protein